MGLGKGVGSFFVMRETPGCAGQSRGTREAQQQQAMLAVVKTDDEDEDAGEAA